MKKIADGDPWTMPATIDDPVILDEIAAALKGKGTWRLSGSGAVSPLLAGREGSTRRQPSG